MASFRTCYRLPQEIAVAKQRKDHQPVQSPGPARSHDPATEPSPGLARFILLTSLGVGLLAGLV